MKVLLLIFAMSGNFYNDVLALVSVIGTFLMLLGSLWNGRFGWLVGIGEWSLSAVVFGILFQFAMGVTGLIPDQIGFVFPMYPAMVNGLFALSCAFLAGYWWFGRKKLKEN
jgi:hypothetical protein